MFTCLIVVFRRIVRHICSIKVLVSLPDSVAKALESLDVLISVPSAHFVEYFCRVFLVQFDRFGIQVLGRGCVYQHTSMAVALIVEFVKVQFVVTLRFHVELEFLLDPAGRLCIPPPLQPFGSIRIVQIVLHETTPHLIRTPYSLEIAPTFDSVRKLVVYDLPRVSFEDR